MTYIRILLLLGLASCTAVMESPCDPEACPGNFGCHPDGYCVDDRCSDDGECKSGYVCEFGGCETLCRDEDCPGGFSCNSSLNECNDYCLDDDECRSDRECCTSDRLNDGRCTSEKLNRCVRT